MLRLALAIDLASALCCLFAFWKGGPGERAAGAAVAINLLIGQAGHYLTPHLGDQFRVANDGLTALLLLVITLRTAAPWMGAVMLFYAVQFSMHSYYLVTERKGGDYLHALINNLDFIGINLCLVAGVAAAWRGRLPRARATPAT
jgi:hypothetical protein